jgi:hypothetical protein
MIFSVALPCIQLFTTAVLLIAVVVLFRCSVSFRLEKQVSNFGEAQEHTGLGHFQQRF